jgi:hypothetical protein
VGDEHPGNGAGDGRLEILGEAAAAAPEPGKFGALPDDHAGFVPVRLASASATLVAPVAADEATPAPAVNETSPVVEIVLPNGCRLRVPAEIEASSLHRLVTVLKTAV